MYTSDSEKTTVNDIDFFRAEHGKIAMLRDDGLCQYHHHILGLEYPASEGHHVQGRARAPDMRETWLYRLSLCHEHHRQYHTGKIDRIAMSRVCDDANKYPVRYWFMRDYIRQMNWTPPIKEYTKTTFFNHACVGNTECSSSWITWDGNFGLCMFCLYGFILLVNSY